MESFIRTVVIIIGMNIYAHGKMQDAPWTLKQEIPVLLGIFIVILAADWGRP